jgi:Ca-activated chloride channel family protein
MITRSTLPRALAGLAIVALVFENLVPLAAQTPQRPDEGFRFRTGVELINISATVTDGSGRFVSGLRKEDFVVYEDGELQNITHFNSERVPVSLGIVLDTSGSMAGDKFQHALDALERFFFDLLDPADEVFLYRFSGHPELVSEWTADRRAVMRALGRVSPGGGTAMYDAIAEAIPLAQSGRHRKKALVVISDGNDTNSRTNVGELKQMIRESEVLVYAIGIDGSAPSTTYGPPTTGGSFPQPRPPRLPIPFPFPIPGRRRPFQMNAQGWPPQGRGGTWSSSSRDQRVNVTALRELTDDSGGRTEIIRTSRDLDPATASVADELSRQYYLGYPARGLKDGRWHTIRVEVRNQNHRVRARRGYVATP